MLVAVRKQGARPHSAESRSATCPTQRGREFCAFVRAAVTPLAPSVAGTAQMRPCRPDCRSAPGAAVSLSERRLSLSAPVLAAERLVASAPGGRASGELRDANRPHTRYLRRGGRGVESQRRSAPLATRVSPGREPAEALVVGHPPERRQPRPARLRPGLIRFPGRRRFLGMLVAGWGCVARGGGVLACGCRLDQRRHHRPVARWVGDTVL